MMIYFGGNKLFKSYDRGDRWHVISPDLSNQDADKIAGNVPHCTITTIDESPLRPDRLLVGTDDGNVQWADDGGKNWTAVLIHGVPPCRWVSRVEFSHHDPDTAYGSFTGYQCFPGFHPLSTQLFFEGDPKHDVDELFDARLVRPVTRACTASCV